MRPCAIRHNPTFPVATSYTIGSSGVFFCLISYPTASILQYWLARTQRNCLLLAQCCDSVPSAVLVSVCTSSCLYISLRVKIGRVEVLKWSYQAVADRFEIPTAGHHRRLVTTEPGRFWRNTLFDNRTIVEVPEPSAPLRRSTPKRSIIRWFGVAGDSLVD